MSIDERADQNLLQRRVEQLEKENKKLAEDLKRVDQERIEYLQNVAHQLVAPLNAIKWHIENLTSNRVSVERAKKVLRSIYSQSTIAVHLAKNFALMSNIEADHSLAALKEPLQEVNLCQLLVNLADDFQPLGWDKDLTISVVNAGFEHAPCVWAMRPLLSQAFSNVIENAVKYSNRHSEISITGEYDKRSDIVTVSVANRGIPLPSNDVGRIFERGYRTDAAKNLYPAGTGFGLYIANRIVDIHEGAISASMNQDGVVKFEIALPARALENRGRKRV